MNHFKNLDFFLDFFQRRLNGIFYIDLRLCMIYYIMNYFQHFFHCEMFQLLVGMIIDVFLLV